MVADSVFGITAPPPPIKKSMVTALQIGNATIRNTKSEKLPGITIDSKLTFNEHVKNLCQKASQNCMHWRELPTI